MQIHILVADDDANIRELLRYSLHREGYVVHLAEDGEVAQRVLQQHTVHVAVIDLVMPKLDGYGLAEYIRENYDLPVIMLTAKGELSDKTKGFQSGTDDYLVKPFEAAELLLRIRALLRRYRIQAQQRISLGQTLIDQNKYEVQVGSTHYELPLKEFQLLYYLAMNQGATVTREQIVEHVWGLDWDGDVRTVDVHIKRLREKFSTVQSDFEIQTVRGLGYKLKVMQ
ncbi:MAG: response regulator transcription factor [Bacilli bacterium]